MATRRQRPKTQSSIKRNLQVLMGAAGWNQSELARRSGVSQRHISDILAGKAECTIPYAKALAAPFNLEDWHLLLPNLPNDLIGSPSIAKIISAYVQADASGRAFIDAVAEREMDRFK